MNGELAIKILKDILSDYKTNNFSKDKEALEYAIEALERTAQEVPVQEQPVAYINLDENFAKEVIQKISELNKLLNQAPKITTYQNS